MKAYLRRLLQWPAPVAGVLFFCGERIWPATAARPVLTGLGAAVLLGLLVWQGWHWWQSESSSKGRFLAAWELAPTCLFSAAAAFYLLGLLLPDAAASRVDWAALTGWAWMLAILVGTVLFVFLELATRGGTVAPQPARVARAAQAGVFVALLLALLVTLNFVFARLNMEWDFTFFRAAQPSETTLHLVAGLENPVQVALVFAEDNPVPPLMGNYFARLEKAGPNLKVLRFDADLEPGQARVFKSGANNVIVVKQGGKRREIRLGGNLERARKGLRKLDSSMLGALLDVAGGKKTVYFTVGHGELAANERPEGRVPRTQKNLRALLREQNFEIKELGTGEGLGKEVPLDAGLVVILAPTAAFLPGEFLALRDFLQRGGNLMVFLEPARQRGPDPAGGAGTIEQLLAEYGMVFSPLSLANDRYYVRYTYTPADRGLLVTSEYAPNPFAKSRPGRRTAKNKPLLLLGSGAWERGQVPKPLVMRNIVTTMPGTWGDRNGNFVFDPKENRGQPNVVVSVAPRDGEKAPGPRILGFADVDLALDFLIQNAPNRELLAAAILWMARGDVEAGLPENEEDVRILHAKSDELVWFYLPVFGVPLLVLVLGYFLSIRRYRWEG